MLNCFGVACLTNDDHSVMATVINGDIIKVFAGALNMTYGKKKISAVDTDSVLIVINGALYVPSFFLMQLTDKSIVDFSGDRTAATLETDIAVDASTSGPAGIVFTAIGLLIFSLGVFFNVRLSRPKKQVWKLACIWNTVRKVLPSETFWSMAQTHIPNDRLSQNSEGCTCERCAEMNPTGIHMCSGSRLFQDGLI